MSAHTMWSAHSHIMYCYQCLGHLPYSLVMFQLNLLKVFFCINFKLDGEETEKAVTKRASRDSGVIQATLLALEEFNFILYIIK